MASEENKLLQKTFAPILKAAGYKKSAATWHFDDGTFIRVFNIQGSQWGKSFYLNLGLYIKELGEKLTPKEYECHIRCRLIRLVPDGGRFNDLLNFEYTIPNHIRFQELQQIIECYAIPWLTQHSSKQSLIHLLTSKKPDFFVMKDVWLYLGISQE